MTSKIKLEKQAEKSGCASFFILDPNGNILGTVQKTSYFHQGYQQTKTYYDVYLRRIIRKCPTLCWSFYDSSLRKKYASKEFKQKELPISGYFYANGSPKTCLETGHKVRARMIAWITSNINGEEKCQSN